MGYYSLRGGSTLNFPYLTAPVVLVSRRFYYYTFEGHSRVSQQSFRKKFHNNRVQKKMCKTLCGHCCTTFKRARVSVSSKRKTDDYLPCRVLLSHAQNAILTSESHFGALVVVIFRRFSCEKSVFRRRRTNEISMSY